jgi:hypothetical protein
MNIEAFEECITINAAFGMSEYINFHFVIAMFISL